MKMELQLPHHKWLTMLVTSLPISKEELVTENQISTLELGC